MYAVSLQNAGNPVKGKYVHQFVVQDALKVWQRTAQRQGDATLEIFGKPRYPLRQQVRYDIGLFKIDMRRIHDERNAPLNRMSKFLFEVEILTFGHMSCIGSQLPLFFKKEHVKVRRLHLLP